MTKEEIILHNMKSLNISREEAEQLYEDDLNDYIGEEGEEMTQKAKKNCKTFVQGDIRERKKTKRIRKVDEEKTSLMDSIIKAVKECGGSVLSGNESQIEIDYNKTYYAIKLIKQRNKNKNRG